MTPASPLLMAARRAWTRMTAGLPASTGDTSIVAALCVCVLGESTAGGWPPRSIEELTPHTAPASGVAATELSSLLDAGFAALDLAAVQETGQCFAQISRTAQLHALFRLEAGYSSLSCRRASLFLDAFLDLAAQAYLCDALRIAGEQSR
ncbi:hypothetical protein [Piscinibacter sp. XHJ-5]|uniref:hypothetical protein n=1 Tax=Piscinibacter sp. XHJ-5 TaxID=3037797 RepID=UPI002452DF61|nr:hypothetical protein [Piscinibacter sp. XHJ-5]